MAFLSVVTLTTEKKNLSRDAQGQKMISAAVIGACVLITGSERGRVCFDANVLYDDGTVI